MNNVRTVLSEHDIKVARAILAHLWDLKVQRINRTAHTVWATVSGTPTSNHNVAARKGWYVLPVGHGGALMAHDNWPGARLDINYNYQVKGHAVQVSIYRVNQ